jgi:hypothetical protein
VVWQALHSPSPLEDLPHLDKLALKLSRKTSRLIDGRDRKDYLLLKIERLLFKLLNRSKRLCDRAAQQVRNRAQPGRDNRATGIQSELASSLARQHEHHDHQRHADSHGIPEKFPIAREYRWFHCLSLLRVRQNLLCPFLEVAC